MRLRTANNNKRRVREAQYRRDNKLRKWSYRKYAKDVLHHYYGTVSLGGRMVDNTFQPEYATITGREPSPRELWPQVSLLDATAVGDRYKTDVIGQIVSADYTGTELRILAWLNQDGYDYARPFMRKPK